jgi:hypothetical protein
MTKKKTLNVPLDSLKQTGTGFKTALLDSGELVIVIDTNNPISKSVKGNDVYAISNGFTGTPHGGGFFLNLVLGRRTNE